ncbi:MAG: glucose-6-phosphate dehydrogenase [Nitrospirales bacterium]
MAVAEKEKKFEETAGTPGPPCAIIIFGASGDLTKRKLVPSLHYLGRSNLISKSSAMIGVGHPAMTDEEFRQKVGDDLKEFATAPVDPTLWEGARPRFYYVSGEFGDPKTYQQLQEKLVQVDKNHNTQGNYLYYLATAPAFFSTIVQQLGSSGLSREENGQWRRVIIEKPFGQDYESACALNQEIKKVLNEHQIYRIDHYLGKETVQNIMAFRFGNGIFEPIWNRRYIDHVQITAAETVGVEQRGGYYEGNGALRDMMPNHLFQLVSLTAMEPPISFEADAVRDEQAKVLRAIHPFSSEAVLTCAVRGQYGPGTMNGQAVPGYRSEPNVSPTSTTDTFAAFKLSIENWRWADVPFYIRTGKRLASRITKIVIQFRQAPHLLFRKTAVERLPPNRLVIQIQPDEAITLRFGAKIPGPVVKLGAVDMNFRYQDYFGSAPATGYERLLYDCMCGDATLFQRADMVETGWSVVTPILDVWKALPPRSFPNYAAGTWGPQEADELLNKDGRHWQKLRE